MTIASVGTGQFANSNGFSIQPSSSSNHFILLSVITTSRTRWATSVSNSGNITWSVLVSHQTFSNNSVSETVFIGQVNSTSSQPQTIGFNSGSPTVRAGWQEFSTTSGFSAIHLDAFGLIDTNSGSGTFPPVTPTASGRTYWSFIWDTGTGHAGSTSGYTYAVDSVQGNLQCYNTSCTGSTQTPNIGDADDTAGIGVMVYETGGTGPVTANAVLATGTGTAPPPVAKIGNTANAILAAGTGTAFQPLAGIANNTFVGFPYKQLGLKVELLVNTTWTDITKYVMLRDPIAVSPLGRTDETSGMQAGSMTLTLKNVDGRFTPNNSSGAYYPFVQLNAQVRLSVSDASVNGTTYAGYRFWGEVSEWPPLWDPSGRDVAVSITVSGIWERLTQATATLGSPFTRWNTQLATSHGAIVAGYWPMEDGAVSTTLATVAPGTADAMTVIPTNGQPTLASCTAFPGSDALPQLNGAELSGVMHTATTPGQIMFRFCLFVQSGGDTGTGAATLARLHLGGTLANVDVQLQAAGGGPFVVTGANSGGTTLFTGTLNQSIWGIPLLCQVGLVQSGGKIIWSFNTIIPGTTTWAGTVTGSITGTLDDATSVIFSPGASYKGVSVGQAMVLYSNPSILQDASALQGWEGENALTRFKRVCAEEGIAVESIGTTTTTMGPQIDDTLVNILQTVEDTDGGFIYETQDQFGLGYRTMASVQNQSPKLTLNYTAQQVAQTLAPVNDSSLVRNDVTLANYDGYSVRLYLQTGARSINPPPNGIGSGYAYSRNVNSTSHSQMATMGQQLLNSGTTSENRYPTVTVNLARTTTASLFNSAPSMRVGDYLQVTNMPAFMGGGTEKQLAVGWTETIDNYGKRWTIAYNTIPELPWESGFVPGTVNTGQVPGSPVTAAQSNSVSGAQIAENAITLFSLAQEVLTYQFGGIVSNINSVAPTSPQVGDMWFDSSNGYQIKRWDGSMWAPITFTGTNILGAGTITAGLIGANAVIAGNIAAGSITASQLDAGIVKAGIVDGTLISGAQIVAYGTTGEVLVYSGTPTSGNLVVSLSAMSGTDNQGNSYGTGLWVYDTGGNEIGLVPGGLSAASQLALSNGSGTPTPPSGCSSLYGAGSGVQAVDGTDGNAYGVQRRSLVTNSVQTIAGTFVAFGLSTTLAAPASGRTYRVSGMVWFVSSTTQSGHPFDMQWVGGPGGSFGGQLLFTWVEGTSTWCTGNSANGAPSLPGIAPSANVYYGCYVDGAVTVPSSTSGTFELQCAIGSGGSAYKIGAQSYIDIMPV